MHFTQEWCEAHQQDDEPGGLMACSPEIYAKLFKEKQMHYRNGREAKNGDEIVQIDNNGKINAVGVLIKAVSGNDYCNGIIANDNTKSFVGACMCDCLHVEDVAALLAEKGLDKRPAGK
jgi:hypothetical protein